MKAPAHGENEGQPPRWRNSDVGLEERRKLRNRLRRVEGQVRGLQRMVEEEAPCADILTQVGGVARALEHVGLHILRHQSAQHVRESLRSGEEAKEHRDELILAAERLIRSP